MAAPALEERQSLNGLKQFGKGIFWFAVGTVAQGGQVWNDIVTSCRQFADEKDVADGQTCVWSLLTTMFHSAVYAQSIAQTSITFANVMHGLTSGGNVRRAEAGTAYWTSRWYSLSAAQKDQLRSQMRDVHHGISLHSVGDGSSDIDNSASYYMSHGDDGRAGPYIRHVTNGTHGFIHPVMPGQQHPANFHKRTDPTFGFGQNVAGVKFSYNHPCMHEVVADNVQNGDDFLDSVVGFEQYAAANPSDKWTIEFDDQYSGNLIMYGTLVAERGGFGSEYEEPTFNPLGLCTS